MAKTVNKPKILIVEDNLLVATSVQDILIDEGYDADIADTGKDAVDLLEKSKYNVILLDMMLPDTTGKKLLVQWQAEKIESVIVFMTAHGDIPTAVECLKEGAFDFLTKPVEHSLLVKTVETAIKHGNMSHQVKVLTKITQREVDYSQMGDVIGSAPNFDKTLKMIDMVVKNDFSCLLIQGESGTGKGLMARVIHKMGTRADQPFVEVNCSALPANLIESELFGHEKGAFTDAKADKMGLFEMADKGTLFLDEIGDMDFNLQAKLLKVMEEQTFRRIGGVKDITVNVSIIAATNQPIEKLVKEEKFRLDLYYRLNIIPVNIPSLRERKEDIPLLADYFINFFSRKFGKEITGLSKKCLNVLKTYSWPGNIREFKNVIERASILTPDTEIKDPNILFPTGLSSELNDALQEKENDVNTNSTDEASIEKAIPLAEAEKNAIKHAMDEAEGNKNKASEILGVHRTTLYKKLEEYNLG